MTLTVKGYKLEPTLQRLHRQGAIVLGVRVDGASYTLRIVPTPKRRKGRKAK